MSTAWGGQPPNLSAGTHWGAPGIGILGATMKADWQTGEHGPSPLANDLLGDANEYRWFVVTVPSGGTVAATELGRAVVTVLSDGAQVWSYQLVEDGVTLTGPTVVTIVVGGIALAPLDCVQSNSCSTGAVTITQGGTITLQPLDCVQTNTSSVGASIITEPGITLLAQDCSQVNFCGALGPVIVIDAPTGTLPGHLSDARTYRVALDLPGNILGLVPEGPPVWGFDLEATLDFTVDWTDWLLDSADTPAQGVITAPQLTVVAQGIVGGKLAGVFRATTLGRFSAAFKIVTADGRTDERTIYLEVTQR